MENQPRIRPDGMAETVQRSHGQAPPCRKRPRYFLRSCFLGVAMAVLIGLVGGLTGLVQSEYRQLPGVLHGVLAAIALSPCGLGIGLVIGLMLEVVAFKRR